eukprot:176614-Alexandrium_andersonii.AAC.1
MADSLHRQGRNPSTEAHWDPIRAALKWAPYYWCERSALRATSRAASQCRKLLRKSIFAHSATS